MKRYLRVEDELYDNIHMLSIAIRLLLVTPSLSLQSPPFLLPSTTMTATQDMCARLRIVKSLATQSHAELFALGRAAIEEGRMEEAREYFSKALAADSEHAATKAIVEKLGSLTVENESAASLKEELHTLGSGEMQVAIKVLSDPNTAFRCGGLWASASVLVQWLAEKPERIDRYVRGKRVLELGSGLGLVGVGLAKLGASHVHLTDLPQQIPLLRQNVEANFDEERRSGEHIVLSALPWGLASSLLPQPAAGDFFDLVVATDVCYDAALVAPLTKTLSDVLQAQRRGGGGVGALLALPLRSDFAPPARGGADGASVRPDYELLTQALAEPQLGGFRSEHLATVPSEPHPIDILRVH